MPRSRDRAATDQRMAAVHALGHPSSPAPRTAWEPLEFSQSGGSAVPKDDTAAPAAMPPNAPGIPVLAQGIGSDLIVTWTAPTVDPGHGAATGFLLRHAPAGAETWTIVPDVDAPYQLSDLPSAAAIDVQLQAINGGGLSMWSATASLTTGVTSPVSSMPLETGCPPANKPAGTARRIPPVSRCRIATRSHLLCRLARRLRTYLRWLAHLLHLSDTRRRERRNP